MRELITWTNRGLYCGQCDLFIDPTRQVDRAIITHGHSDHARRGCGQYLTARPGVGVLKLRLGKKSRIASLAFGESITVNGVRISLHPAGHILGSAQVRLEHRGEIWVVSGDYKRQTDATCKPFEVLRCHTFITESTFGLPIYNWPPPAQAFEAINRWWSANAARGRRSVIAGYALGKTQRLLMGLDPSTGPIYIHKTIEAMNVVYDASGVKLPATCLLDGTPPPVSSMILAPPNALRGDLMDTLEPASVAIASGWAQVAKTQRARGAAYGFILSDHADWQGLIGTIKETEAERVLVHHGMAETLANYLSGQGLNATGLTPRNALNLAQM